MTRDRQLFALGVCLLVLLVFGVGYVLPRLRSMDRLRADIAAAEKAKAELDKLLPAMAEVEGAPPPLPKPNVTSWIQANALRGLDRRVTTNSPYRNGQGDELKLRSLKPDEVTTLLGILTQVRLSVRRLQLTDLNGRGVWDLQVMLEVPEGS